jgi:hypothetical protein
MYLFLLWGEHGAIIEKGVNSPLGSTIMAVITVIFKTTGLTNKKLLSQTTQVYVIDDIYKSSFCVMAYKFRDYHKYILYSSSNKSTIPSTAGTTHVPSFVFTRSNVVLIKDACLFLRR